MQIAVIRTLLTLFAYFGFSCMMIVAIAWSHYPFTIKDFLKDLLKAIQSAKFTRGFMKGKTLKSKGENDNGKHGEERDHHQ